MRAITITGPRQTAASAVDLPAPGPGQVEIRVIACGVCGSNLHAWAHPELTIQRDGPGHPGAAGHEIAGDITRVGSGVSTLAIGDQVCVEPNLATGCARCAACVNGRAWFCREQSDLPVWGFAESMIIPARAALRPPSPIEPTALTLAEPLAVAFHALRSCWTALGPGLGGSHVAVVGAGMTGLMGVAAARELGAGRISVLARHPQQAAAAAGLGADAVVEGTVDAGDAVVRNLRADIVLEAVGGRSDSLAIAIAATGRAGEVVVMGLFDERQSFDARRAVFRELRMFFPVTYGTLDGVTDFSLALDLLARQQSVFASLVTHTRSLDLVDEAFALAADKTSGALRVVVTP